MCHSLWKGPGDVGKQEVGDGGGREDPGLQPVCGSIQFAQNQCRVEMKTLLGHHLITR